jgi:DMSO/TMAO reductase YedYZ molybdopterin-dependent catalytic subunit
MRLTESGAVAATPEDGAAAARRPSRDWAAAAGVVASGAALAATELTAGLLDGVESLVVAVGDTVIDTVPGSVERGAIDVFGTADKPILIVSIVVVALALGAVVGRAAARRFAVGAAGVAAFAVAGVAAALRDARTSVVPAVVVGVVGAAVGIWLLHRLLRRASAVGADAAGGLDRRGFLALAGATVVGASLAAVGGRLLAGRERVAAIRAAIRLPLPARPAAAAPAGAELAIAGLTPLYVPNRDFYRIDTALTVPQVDPQDWRLKVGGLVDRPFELSFDELLAMPHIEADVTLSCVSNEVGGGLVGNARWQGVPLHVLLERAGVRPGGTQIMTRSVDGFTAGFPTAVASEQRDAMVAIAMNGEPLPARHGFPARLVVPGLYGYVSATKWLASLELVDLAQDGYWIPRGWSKDGPVKTQSRIDVPGRRTVRAGRQPVAGVAWAPTRGIRRVEVQVDGGAWQEARLAAAIGPNSWRQWVYEWDATPGEHVIAVRATDGAGAVQPPERTDVAPNGATGHHTVDVRVEA